MTEGSSHSFQVTSEEGLVYLETAVRMDQDRTWVYAWAQIYLGVRRRLRLERELLFPALAIRAFAVGMAARAALAL